MKLTNSLNVKQLIETEWFEQFDSMQQKHIEEGLLQGLQVELYADPRFTATQMQEIRRAIEERRQWLSNPKDQCRFARFAYEEFDDLQLDELAIGLLRGVNVDLYAHRSLNHEEMHVIRRGLEMGVNVLNLVYNGHDLIEIHEKLGVDNFYEIGD